MNVDFIDLAIPDEQFSHTTYSNNDSWKLLLIMTSKTTVSFADIVHFYDQFAYANWKYVTHQET